MPDAEPDELTYNLPNPDHIKISQGLAIVFNTGNTYRVMRHRH